MSQPNPLPELGQLPGEDRGFPRNCFECKLWVREMVIDESVGACLIDHDVPPCMMKEIDYEPA